MSTIDFDNLFAQADRFREGGQVREAIRAYQDIAVLAAEAHEFDNQARALRLAGFSASMAVNGQPNSYYRDATDFYRQAEGLYIGQKNQRQLGVVHRDMAMAADSAADYHLALEKFHQAIEELTDIDAFGELAVTYDKLGVHYLNLGQLEDAKKYIDRALTEFGQEPTSGQFRATTLFDSACIEFKSGQMEAALELALESLSWFEADHPGKNFSVHQAELLGLIAVIYGELADTKQTEKYFERYQRLLKTFDPLAITTIEKKLRSLAP